jgi:hypothetical protein
MIGQQQEAVQVSLLEADLPGVGTAARRARDGLRNHCQKTPVGPKAGMMASPGRNGAAPMLPPRTARRVRDR